MTKKLSNMNRLAIRHLITIWLLFLNLGVVASWARPFSDSLNHVTKGSVTTISGQRYFTELNGPLNNIEEVTDPMLLPELFLADSLEEKRARAHSLRDKVEQAQRFRETLDAFSVVDLPMGVIKSGGLLDYSIVIDKVTWTRKVATLEAYMSFTVPQTGDRIAFGGKIPLTKEGGIAGIVKIYLLGDHVIKMNNNSLLTLKGSFTNNTFVELDCNGFKAMSLEGEVEFSKDLLIPENEKGDADESKRLKINFQAYVQDWNELMVKVSVPPFQVKGLRDVGFTVQDAYMDWSDLTNPTGLAFPLNYQSSYTGGGQQNLWRGFFLRQAQIRLPKKMKEDNNSTRTSLTITNLIIDDTGFSGIATGTNLIQEGSMSGWSYSLDRLKVGVVSNHVEEFDLAGKITVPAFQHEGKPVRMGYRAAQGAEGNYIFSVTIVDQVKLPLWGADVILNQGSGIIVREKNDQFYPTATLNGMLSINTLSKGPKSTLTGIRFEQLILSTEAPYFRPGTFGFGSGDANAKASGFPLVIRNVGIKSDNNDVGLSFDVTLNISGKAKDEGFSGTAGLIVWGSMGAPSSQTQGENKAIGNANDGSWEFKKVEITAVGIDIKKPGVYELNGMVRFFDNDPTYGDGFGGNIKGVFKNNIVVTAEALFGRTPTFRYWFADALGTFGNGLLMAPGFYAYSFGGGFYSSMKQSSQKSLSGIGASASGITYLPDENSMGLRAYMDFGAKPVESFNGNVTLAIAMNRSGGINSVSLIGNAYFLTPTVTNGIELIKAGASSVATEEKKKPDLASPRSQVYGSVNLLFDNENNVFHGNIEVYVNVVGGIVKGIGAGNKAGWAVVHFSQEEWYILIGTPEQPIGLEVARLFKSKSYFMMGKNLPGSPPPPAKVSEILGGVNLDYMRDMNALQSGLGFAFGMSFGVDTGDLRFLMFYGRFSAGAGFDIMLKNYGDRYHCEGSTGPMGINGWYANGQAYAFVQGKVGIKVNLKFYKGDYDILAIGAAAILQAKGPNPFWMKGIVGGQYRILGGLVKGNCRFEVTVGKDCKPVGEQNLLDNTSIIASISPGKGEKDVNVYNGPQVAFNIPVDKIFEMTDIEDRKHAYRARLAGFSLTKSGTPIEGAFIWNDNKDVLVLDPRDILDPKKEFVARATVLFEEKIGDAWQPVVYDGARVEEVVESTFETGEAPDQIIPSNIEYSYPVTGQYNFYPEESNRGVVQLKKGQQYLFTPSSEWMQKIRLSNPDTQTYSDFDFVYKAEEKRIEFTLPGDIGLEKVYQLEILNIPRQNKVAMDANVKSVERNLSNEAGETTVTSKKVEGQVNLIEIKSLYRSNFRSSKYRTFEEKINSLSLSNSFTIDQGVNRFRLSAYFRGEEFFDSHELNLIPELSPALILDADLESSPWYKEDVYPIVYEGYPLLGFVKLSRDTSIFGVPPKRSVVITQTKSDYWLGTNEPPLVSANLGISTLNNDLMLTMTDDYYTLQSQIANLIVEHPSSYNTRLNRLLVQPFPVMRNGQYTINIRYFVPGNKNASSGGKWILNKR